MKMNSKVYDVLKWVCMFFLPALSVLVEGVFPIWGIPYGAEISSTLVKVNAFLAMCLGISCINYNKNKNNEEEQAE